MNYEDCDICINILSETLDFYLNNTCSAPQGFDLNNNNWIFDSAIESIFEPFF
jgi:hypothetical protein